jgi:DNA mismatch repair protein MutS
MSSLDRSGSGATFPTDGALTGLGSQVGRARHSVLFERPDRVVDPEPPPPDFFADLNLDQLLESMTAGREQYGLDSFFCAPLREVAAVRYRHEVLRDLEKPQVRAPIATFSEAMARMRAHLEQVEALHYELQKQSWFLDAIEIYCEAVASLSQALLARELNSRGLLGLRSYLDAYVASQAFTSLVEETQALRDALAGIRYSIRIQGPRVTVDKHEGNADYSEQVRETFSRFQQEAVRSYLVSWNDSAQMNHVEARILDGVAELHPDVFATRADYCARHRDYLDVTVARFDREVQFYLAFLDLVERVRRSGLSFCYPQVSAESREIAATDTFDIALAVKLIGEKHAVVVNDFYLKKPERMFVVSGPNNGGKTTFARTFGQMHYLASLGLLVPGTEARLFLPDRIFTHFEREEDIETLRGKFDDELVRVQQVLEQATASSIIVMNESFSSTTLNDALFVGTAVMRRILALGCLGVYVTFVDEIASLSEATVSVVAQVVPENPAQRTFKVLRRPADGIAYASALAEKHELTYERLLERIGT